MFGTYVTKETALQQCEQLGLAVTSVVANEATRYDFNVFNETVAPNAAHDALADQYCGS